ncbi:MAG: N-glycosylase/DNA lyase [Bacteroidota bacterium]
MKTLDKKILQQLYRLHGERREAIQKRLKDFSQVLPSQYFYELAYCILTPQSSAVNATQAVGRLQASSFFEMPFDPEPILFQKDFYIRFHRTKARLLLRLRESFPDILDALSESTPPAVLREWLVEHVHGFGYKEASHFLRNIGHRDLAILDRHILKNLKRLGAIRAIPKTLTRKQYLILESQFHRFADTVGIPLDELDLLFWSIETGEILK